MCTCYLQGQNKVQLKKNKFIFHLSFLFPFLPSLLYIYTGHVGLFFFLDINLCTL